MMKILQKIEALLLKLMIPPALYKYCNFVISIVAQSNSSDDKRTMYIGSLPLEQRMIRHMLLGAFAMIPGLWFWQVTLFYYFCILIKEMIFDVRKCYPTLRNYRELDPIYHRYTDNTFNCVTMGTKMWLDMSQHATGSFIVLFIYYIFC